MRSAVLGTKQTGWPINQHGCGRTGIASVYSTCRRYMTAPPRVTPTGSPRATATQRLQALIDCHACRASCTRSALAPLQSESPGDRSVMASRSRRSNTWWVISISTAILARSGLLIRNRIAFKAARGIRGFDLRQDRHPKRKLLRGGRHADLCRRLGRVSQNAPGRRRQTGAPAAGRGGGGALPAPHCQGGGRCGRRCGRHLLGPAGCGACGPAHGASDTPAGL